ncbi:MAG TPA: zinc ribbon domain-containing protein [Gaiellaceae bacterium]|nr:zinc ribbon domain-containing protein [Gaiellaceae bacterium]
MTTCPRCGEPAAQGQEYCLACGARLAAPSGAGAGIGSQWWQRALLAAVVALLGGVAAVAATGGNGSGGSLRTAVGGFVTVAESNTLPSPSDEGPTSVADWPSGTDGWTVVLASFPQTGGRKAADARAKRARARGLPQVGVLDSSSYASLHPGYWVVFSGIYGSEAEATSALEPARKASKTAVVRHVVA